MCRTLKSTGVSHFGAKFGEKEVDVGQIDDLQT